ncbi:unknown [Collinsella sp. CAG:398]|nr:unknown [Collinsella sp. CAG:398]
MARWQMRSTCSMEWLKNSTVTSPDSMKCWMRASHFYWKNTSPTESVSSTIKMSGDVKVAMANAMRATMPLE